ncbi:MAG: hypothetical protein H7Z20_07205 [Bdellovibrio sp.]|nr:hypothetical protein [Methylotenera sp.]
MERIGRRLVESFGRRLTELNIRHALSDVIEWPNNQALSCAAAMSKL